MQLFSMGQGKKRLAQMRNNPKDDWKIDDLKVVCNEHGLVLEPPSGGSHWTVVNSVTGEFLTVPAHGKIKAFYIKQFVEMVDKAVGGKNDG